MLAAEAHGAVGKPQHTLPLSELDAVAVLGGASRLHLRRRDASELVIRFASAAEAVQWKQTIQQCRGASPKRAFLHDAIGKALTSARPLAASEMARWLCLAASWGETEEACALLRGGGVAVSAHGTHRRTALHYAALNGHAGTVEALLGHRADPNARDADGTTPLEAALEFGHVACAALLAASGSALSARVEELALGPHVPMAAGRLLASLRSAEWAATKGVGLLGSPSAPKLSRGGSQRVASLARRISEEDRRNAQAWQAMLDAAPPPPTELSGGGAAVESRTAEVATKGAMPPQQWHGVRQPRERRGGR